MFSWGYVLLTVVSIALFCGVAVAGETDTKFGPSNPFYAASTLPFQAPPFDKIKSSDYQPAIEAGMAQQIQEVTRIADNPAPPTFENTIVRHGKDRAAVQSRVRVSSTRSPARTLTRCWRKCRRSKLPNWPLTRMPSS